MQHSFWYISLPSLHDHDVKFPCATCYGERKYTTTNFSFSFESLVRSQLQGNSPTFNISKPARVNAKMLGKTRIHFGSYVFLAVAVVVAKLPDSLVIRVLSVTYNTCWSALRLASSSLDSTSASSIKTLSNVFTCLPWNPRMKTRLHKSEWGNRISSWQRS